MLETINQKLILILIFAALLGVLFGMVVLLLPFTAGEDFELRQMANIERHDDFSISWLSAKDSSVSSNISPHLVEILVKSPKPLRSDMVMIQVFANGRHMSDSDCLGNFEFTDAHPEVVQFTCTAEIPYPYKTSQEYRLYAVFSGHGNELVSGPLVFHADWSGFEAGLWNLLLLLAMGVIVIYSFIILPITSIVLRIANHTKHPGALPREYSIWALFHPMSVGKTMLQHINSFIVSPYFWGIEFMGILVILFYMAATAQIWHSTSALFAFIISGLLAFIVPFLWCVAWWYAEYTGREPLRILITFFLWGMVAALMAIGVNTVAGVVLGIFGLGALLSFLLVPPVEEFYKAAGLGLLSEHHDYKSVQDGLVFGFVIGMGYSFIENWLYFLNNPIGSDPMQWLSVFVLRSVFFSANHGIYTALIGGAVGYLEEVKFRAPVLGIFIALPVAAFLHAIHNSGEAIAAFLGGGGLFVYFCFLIPLFDYGALILLIVLFIRSMLRRSTIMPARSKRRG